MKQIVQLNEILGNKKVINILDFFIDNGPIEISQSGIIIKTNIAKATAVKWLSFLVMNKFLLCKKIGTTNLYKLNYENIVIKQFKIIKTIIQLQALNTLKVKNIEIYLYGSASRGENNKESDIDLLIIGKIQRNEIVDALDKLSKRIKRKINFNIFNNLEWSKMQKKDKAYYERVEKDKVKII
jgi:predicted nucleotidyltransferase